MTLNLAYESNAAGAAGLRSIRVPNSLHTRMERGGRDDGSFVSPLICGWFKTPSHIYPCRLC